MQCGAVSKFQEAALLNWRTFLLFFPSLNNHFEAVYTRFALKQQVHRGHFKGILGNGNSNLRLMAFVEDS